MAFWKKVIHSDVFFKFMEKRKKRGRPTKYKPQYCRKIIDFFSVEPYRELRIQRQGKPAEYKLIPNALPFFAAFARSIKVDEDTVVEWAKVYPAFSASYKKAKALQKEFLIENGLLGLYNPAFAIFTAKNITDMRNEDKVEHSGQVEFTSYEKLKDVELNDELYKKLKEGGEDRTIENA